MTDMRATERLLEVIAENAENLLHRQDREGMATEEARKVIEAIAELRRRGDTLVWAEDLRTVTEAIARPAGYLVTDYAKQIAEALDRLENALGGRLA